MTEPGAGSDVAGLKTKAEKVGDEVNWSFNVSNAAMKYHFQISSSLSSLRFIPMSCLSRVSLN